MNHGEPYEAEQERDEAVAQLRDLRRQMEEQRKQGNWPLSKVVAERDRLADAARVINGDGTGEFNTRTSALLALRDALAHTEQP